MTAALCAAVVGGATAAPGASAAPVCSKATATQLVNADELNDFLLADPVAQVLCGPFTGSGSTAMTVALAAPTCWAIQRWALFELRGGSWRLVSLQRGFSFPLVARGFLVRGRSIRCVMEDGPLGGQVQCQHEGPPVWSLAGVTNTGRVSICQQRRPACIGDPGEDVRFTTLAPGRSMTVGRFRCRVAAASVACVVIRTGRGLAISARGVRRL